MRFKMTVELENAAFEENDGFELAKILRQVERKIQDGKAEANLQDSNGNTVGSFTISE